MLLGWIAGNTLDLVWCIGGGLYAGLFGRTIILNAGSGLNAGCHIFQLFVLLQKRDVDLVQFDQVPAHLGKLLVLVDALLLVLGAGLVCGLGFLHPSLHLLHELGQLSVLLVLLVECLRNLSVLRLHLANHHVSLLELLLNDLQLSRISESILALDYFLELVSEASAFINVELVLDLHLIHL